MRRVLIVLLALIAMVGAAAAGLWRVYDAPGSSAGPVIAQVPRGGVDAVASSLARAGLIAPGPIFPAAVALTRSSGTLHAGEFEFPAQASLRQVLAVLRAGRAIQHKLTVAEGLTAIQIGALLNAAPALDGPPAEIIEGLFLPETYVFERGTLRTTIAQRARTAMERALDRAWQGRRQNLAVQTPAELLTLASIVERETARPDERPRVSAVFHNRLRQRMKLQSDPTTIYAISRSGVLDHALTRAELDRDDPYNTYRAPALPPGPICMPGVLSLMAAARPDDAADLYFVADGTGGHAFAPTQEQHLRNVARWRDIERQRASK